MKDLDRLTSLAGIEESLHPAKLILHVKSAVGAEIDRR